MSSRNGEEGRRTTDHRPLKKDEEGRRTTDHRPLKKDEEGRRTTDHRPLKKDDSWQMTGGRARNANVIPIAIGTNLKPQTVNCKL